MLAGKNGLLLVDGLNRYDEAFGNKANAGYVFLRLWTWIELFSYFFLLCVWRLSGFMQWEFVSPSLYWFLLLNCIQFLCVISFFLCLPKA